MSSVAERNKSLQLLMVEDTASAREQVILANQELVRYVIKSLGLNAFDEDLFQIGCVGLIKAVDSFDFDKNIKFSTYAAKVIRNEILMTLRKKHINAQSLDELFTIDGFETSLMDMVSDGTCMEDELISTMYLEQAFSKLNNNEKKIIYLHFIKGTKQHELAKMMGFTQSYISRMISEIIKKMRRI